MAFSRLLVHACYQLEQSTRYRAVKAAVYDLLENPRAWIRPYFDIGMMLLVLTSVFLLLYDVKHGLGEWSATFEYVVVSVFICEYLLRFWVYNDAHKIIIEHYERAELINARFSVTGALLGVLRHKWSYITSPLALIDLLAILPSYRPLRILRIFLLFRLFKLFRYARSVNQFVTVLSEKKVELYTLFSFLAFLLLISASAIYLFESPNEGGQIDGFTDGIYWALVTLSTVGYGDITPQTPEGRLVAMALILSGVAVLAFFTSIIVSAFNEKMGDVHVQHVISELERHQGYIIICGFGRIGSEVALALAREKERFVVVDPDPERVLEAKHRGYLAVQGEAERIELLRALGVQQNASRILCLTSDDVINVYLTLSARQMNPDIEIISRANRVETTQKLRLAGANHVIQPFKIAGSIAAEYIGQPVAFEAMSGVFLGGKEFSLETVRIHDESRLIGQRLRDLPLKELHLILLGVVTPDARQADELVRVQYSLVSRHFQFNPSPDFHIHAGDILVVIGHNYSILHFKERIEAARA